MSNPIVCELRQAYKLCSGFLLKHFCLDKATSVRIAGKNYMLCFVCQQNFIIFILFKQIIVQVFQFFLISLALEQLIGEEPPRGNTVNKSLLLLLLLLLLIVSFVIQGGRPVMDSSVVIHQFCQEPVTCQSNLVALYCTVTPIDCSCLFKRIDALCTWNVRERR